MAQYFVLKQAFPNAEIWVAQLGETDTIYVYETREEAQAKLEELEAEFPDRKFKVSDPMYPDTVTSEIFQYLYLD
jgi:hypothetical protein